MGYENLEFSAGLQYKNWSENKKCTTKTVSISWNQNLQTAIMLHTGNSHLNMFLNLNSWVQ